MDGIDEALIDATRENNLREVRRLLRAGAAIEVKDYDHCGFTPLHEACYHGYLQVFNELLERGADIEAQSNVDWTPLHVVSWAGHMQVLEALLNVGADVHATTELHRSLIHI